MLNHEIDNLPDVANEKKTDHELPLDWVGMQEIDLPVLVEQMRVPAKVSAFVSLDQKSTRGIHMSRLYKIIQTHLSSQPLSFQILENLVSEFLISHEGLSSSAKIKLQFQLPVQRTSLKSDLQAWRTYPVTWLVQKQGDITRFFMETVVAYSSTCPASAALARQLNKEHFEAHFPQNMISKIDVAQWLQSQQGMAATPHAQRSYAQVKIELKEEALMTFADLIDLIEEVLQTPVQTIVKREDEQEFALRNGQNLMFCEDAARRIQKRLAEEPQILSFQGHVRHVESLHPHDAVSYFSHNRNN
jgi:GTP cyclohydrolase I